MLLSDTNIHRLVGLSLFDLLLWFISFAVSLNTKILQSVVLPHFHHSMTYTKALIFFAHKSVTHVRC